MADRPDPFAPRPQQPPPPVPEPEPIPEPAPRAPLWAGRADDSADDPYPEVVTHTDAEAKDRLKKYAAPTGFAALAAWKIGRIVLVALGKVAFLFKIPLFATVLSGAISIGAYAIFYGWTFAAGLVGSIFVHELGHVAQLKFERIPVRALHFIPFFGAYVVGDADRTPEQAARVGVAGPVAGTLCALAVYVFAPDEPVWHAVAYTGFFLNLFNLLPLPLLDGGHTGIVFNPAWWLIVAAALAATAALSSQVLVLVVALGALYMAYHRRAEGFALAAGPPIALKDRAQTAAAFIAVCVVCSFGMSATFQDRTSDLVDKYGAVPTVTVHRT